MAIGGQTSEISCSIPEVEDVRQPVYQRQANDDRGNELSHPIAIGGQIREISRPIPEMEEIAGLNTREQQSVYQQSDAGRSNDLHHSLLNGEDHVSREESSIQESFASQLVNGQQQQPRYQQCARSNSLSQPNQDMALDASQRRDRQELCHPIQETGPFTERTLDELEDLPPCHHQFSGADINGVSSTGQTEQAVEHNCSRQELQLWKQELDRQAHFTHNIFAWEIKYIEITIPR